MHRGGKVGLLGIMTGCFSEELVVILNIATMVALKLSHFVLFSTIFEYLNKSPKGYDGQKW